MEWDGIQEYLSSTLTNATAQIQRLPGSAIALRYVQSSYQNDPIRSAIELILFLFAVRYLLAPSYSVRKQNGYVEFTDKEIDELVEDWTPEPLVGSPTAFEEAELEKRPVIVGPTGPKTRLSNGRTVTNLASFNFYNFVGNDHLKESAIQTLRTYGVGPCGPPNFYGTQDVHMKTEADIAAHIGVASAIVYAQSFSTISSVIPCFSKRGDIIVADKAINYAVRKGLQLSRSAVRWYEHNDMEDLEKVLKKLVKEQAGRPLTRRFIITEGLFEYVGDMANLPALVELKLKYKLRLILDETWSYGVLGRTGAGLTQHQNVDPTLVDMIIGSLAGPLCGGGGFCAGAEDVVEIQRITSASYTFSAALPALLATTASETINILQSDAPGQGTELIGLLRETIRTFRQQLDPRSDWVRCSSAADNPIQLLVLKNEFISASKLGTEEQEQIMHDVIDECLNNGVLITRLKGMPLALGVAPKDQGWQTQPALKICLTTGLTKKETEKAAIIIRHAITKVVSKKR